MSTISNPNDNIIPFQKVVWGQKNWGDFIWGELRAKPVNKITEFPKLEIGGRYLYGDPFVQTLLIDYFEDSIYPEFIQKQLALDNKEFTQNNVKEYIKNKTLLLLPFFNYSQYTREKSLKHLVTASGSFLTTNNQDNLILEGQNVWTSSSDVTFTEIEKTTYGLIYENLKFLEKGNFAVYNFKKELENDTNINVLSFYLRVNSGKIRIGLANDNSFLTATQDKFISYDSNKWIHKKIFFNTSILNVNRILIEAYTDNTEIDIFGIEYIPGVPDFSEKIHMTKEIFTDFFSSNDYRLINLL